MQYQLVIFVVIFATAHAQKDAAYISAASERSVKSEIAFSDDVKSQCAAYLNTSLSDFLLQIERPKDANGTPTAGKVTQDILNKKVTELMNKCQATTITGMQFVTTETTMPKPGGFYIEQMIVQRIEINPRVKRQLPDPPESTLASSASPSSTTASPTTEEGVDPENPENVGNKCPCRPEFESEYNQLLEERDNLTKSSDEEISQLKEQLKSRNCSEDVQQVLPPANATDCETEVEQLRTENDELKTNISDCEASLEQMKEDAENAKQTKQAKQDYETALEIETKMKNQFQNDLKVANKKIEELKLAELDFERLLAQERSEKDALKKFIKTLEDKWLQFDLDLKILLEKMNQGNDTKKDLEKQLEASKQREDSMLKEKIEALLEVDRLNNDIKTLNSDMKIMNKEKEVLQFNVSYLLEIGKENDARIELTTSQVKKDCEESKFILKATQETELKKLEKDKTDLYAKITECTDMLEGMKALVEEKQSTVEELEAEKDALLQRCGGEKSEMEEQLDNASVFTKRVLEEKKKVEMNASECAITFNNLEIQMENHNAEMLDLRKILADKTKLQVDLENTISKYGAKCQLKKKFDNSNPPEQFSIVTNPPCRYD